jgi:hypothetical protein
MHLTNMIIFLTLVANTFGQITFDLYGNINTISEPPTSIRRLDSLGMMTLHAPAMRTYCSVCDALILAMTTSGSSHSGMRGLKRYCKHCIKNV